MPWCGSGSLAAVNAVTGFGGGGYTGCLVLIPSDQIQIQNILVTQVKPATSCKSRPHTHCSSGLHFYQTTHLRSGRMCSQSVVEFCRRCSRRDDNKLRNPPAKAWPVGGLRDAASTSTSAGRKRTAHAGSCEYVPKLQKVCKKMQKVCSIKGSQVVPHPGTSLTRHRLTSEFRWDRVHWT